jgi:predicted O-linked N-acetylglucosamine transferase (SPINDLY family)
VTFGNLGNFSKVNEAMLKVWARVLKEVPGSRLIFLCGMESQRARLLKILNRESIAANRVEMIEPQPHGEYLQLYHRLDIVLDTFPYNGHTTNLDALWMGVPVVSLAGVTHVSRGGMSILNNIGLPDLVAHSEDDYVRIAMDLAGDLQRLRELRASLRQRMETSVFVDAPRFVRSIETAYRDMWREWCGKETAA